MNPSLIKKIPKENSRLRWDTTIKPVNKSFLKAMNRINRYWVCYLNKDTGYWEVLFDRGAEIYHGWANTRYKVKMRIEGEDGEPCQPGMAHIPLLNYIDPMKHGAKEKERDFANSLAASDENKKKERARYRADRAEELNHKVLRALHEDEHHDKSGFSAMMAHHVGTRSTYFKGMEFEESKGGIAIPKGACDERDGGKSD